MDSLLASCNTKNLEKKTDRLIQLSQLSEKYTTVHYYMKMAQSQMNTTKKLDNTTIGVRNNGLRLFGRIRIQIRIALPAEHFDAAPAVLIFTTSLCPLLITAVPACCLAMTLSPSFVP